MIETKDHLSYTGKGYSNVKIHMHVCGRWGWDWEQSCRYDETAQLLLYPRLNAWGLFGSKIVP